MTTTTDTLSGKSVLVTGGAGFIGSHLNDALLDAGAEVMCVDSLIGSNGRRGNVEHLLGHPRFTFICDDAVDWIETNGLDGVDFVFNQMASKNTVSVANPARDLRVNALGTLRVLLASAEAGVQRVVHASTGSVYGELSATQDEQHPTRPVSFYGTSKLAGESYCRAVSNIYGLEYAVLRYFHVIGTRQDDSDTGGVVPIFVRHALAGEPLTIFGTGEQVRSFTSVDDVVQANMLVATHAEAAGRTFNCASSIKVTIQELAEYVISATGSSSDIRYADWRPGDIINFDVRNDAITDIGMEYNTNWKAVVDTVIDDMQDGR